MADLTGEKSGISTAVADAVAISGADALPQSMDGEQLALLPLHNGGVLAPAENGGFSPPRGRGRPPGAKNKNTEAWREYLLSRYQSPLIALAEIYSRPVTQIAAELGFTKVGAIGRTATPEELLKLLELQIECAEKLAPYVHQKQPLAIEAGSGGLIPLNIFVGAPPQQGENTPQNGLIILNNETQQNQGVIDIENEKSDAQESDASQETAENKGKSTDKPPV